MARYVCSPCSLFAFPPAQQRAGSAQLFYKPPHTGTYQVSYQILLEIPRQTIAPSRIGPGRHYRANANFLSYNALMSGAASYPAIKLETFEGPYDLLIELARKHKVDLAKISLRTVTDDFLAYIERHKLPAGEQADFMIVAATLMLIKIRQLLPKLTPDEEQEIESLTDRVRIYELYRTKAAQFIKLWGSQRLYPAHFWASHYETAPEDPAAFPAITASDLQAGLQAVIGNLPKVAQPRAHLTIRGRTLHEWLRVFSERLTRVQKLVFQDAVKGASRQDAAVSFLALLEMARKQEISLSQDGVFSHLVVKRIP